MIYIDFIFDIDIIKYSLYFYLYKGIIILYIVKYLLICNVTYHENKKIKIIIYF